MPARCLTAGAANHDHVANRDRSRVVAVYAELVVLRFYTLYRPLHLTGLSVKRHHHGIQERRENGLGGIGDSSTCI